MSTKKMLVLFGVLVLSAVLFTACAGPAGELVPLALLVLPDLPVLPAPLVKQSPRLT